MGVIVSDSMSLETGITVDSYYAAIASECVMTVKNYNNIYDTRGSIQFWVSKSARDEGIPAFYKKGISVSSNVAPTVSPYETIYTEFKTGLTNYEDDMQDSKQQVA